MAASDPALATVLEESRQLGFLGPADIADQIDHALGFARVLTGPTPALALDLGAGGGLPGLVLARQWPASHWILLDANQRRTRFLTRAADQLGIAARVTVVRARAEEAGHGIHRAALDLVTARGFGPPAVTLECGGAFLRPEGTLVVSEPPADPDRWPVAPVAQLGFTIEPGVDRRYQVLRLTGPFPADRPRRVGIPAKRPLF